MNSIPNGKLNQLPEEMFTLIRSTSNVLAPRLGRLSLARRREIDTPHYLGNTSRGVIPHITQDTFRRDTNLSGVYIGLEDCKLFPSTSSHSHRRKVHLLTNPTHSPLIVLERSLPPLYKFRPPDGTSPIRKFIALPGDTLVVVGARRTPAVASPAANSNSNSTIAISTSVGFKSLRAGEYAEAVENLKADILIALADVPYGSTLGNKRVEKATDRSIEWLKGHVAVRQKGDGQRSARMFASLLPVSCAKQQYYIDCLTTDLASEIDGVAVFDTSTLEDFPGALNHLPRLGFTTPAGPHEILQQIHLGLDLFVIPFIGAATDAGIALDFSFPVASDSARHSTSPTPLGVDMWSDSHATDVSSLAESCRCYACTNHHRAYLQHLLMAKEMLGWVLLQIHNHHVMDRFFEGVRCSISNETFDNDVHAFQKTYEPHLPEKTGQGPRIRGYQFKAEGPGEPKKNAAPFTTLNDGKEKLAAATPPGAGAHADHLQDLGFAETIGALRMT